MSDSLTLNLRYGHGGSCLINVQHFPFHLVLGTHSYLILDSKDIEYQGQVPPLTDTDSDVHMSMKELRVKTVDVYNVYISGYETMLRFDPKLHMVFVKHIDPKEHQDLKRQLEVLSHQVQRLKVAKLDASQNPKCCVIM